MQIKQKEWITLLTSELWWNHLSLNRFWFKELKGCSCFLFFPSFNSSASQTCQHNCMCELVFKMTCIRKARGVILVVSCTGPGVDSVLMGPFLLSTFHDPMILVLKSPSHILLLGGLRMVSHPAAGLGSSLGTSPHLWEPQALLSCPAWCRTCTGPSAAGVGAAPVSGSARAPAGTAVCLGWG